MALKAVILIGGPQKGTRFRPLSLELPKPLFPVAGVPTIQHLIEACSKVEGLNEIILMGYFQPSEPLNKFILSMQQIYKLSVRYLQEYTRLGTGGGIYHFRDQIMSGGCERFLVINGDVCGRFPLTDMLRFSDDINNSISDAGDDGSNNSKDKIVILATEATRQQSMNYGCMVENETTHEVLHYVEKPHTFISNLINCGVYLFTPSIFTHLANVFRQRTSTNNNGSGDSGECIHLERDVLQPLASEGLLYLYLNPHHFWSQIKSAGSAVYANRQYLDEYHVSHPERLSPSVTMSPHHEDGVWPHIEGDVYIHPTARVHPTATLGPNVSVGKDVFIGAGVRVKESIILDNATLQDHCCVLHSIIGWSSDIGCWSRVEGTPICVNPNQPFAKIDNMSLFTDGKLNPSITILGDNVHVPPEVIVLNAIVMPHKELGHSYKNQIIL